MKVCGCSSGLAFLPVHAGQLSLISSVWWVTRWGKGMRFSKKRACSLLTSIISNLLRKIWWHLGMVLSFRINCLPSRKCPEIVSAAQNNRNSTVSAVNWPNRCIKLTMNYWHERILKVCFMNVLASPHGWELSAECEHLFLVRSSLERESRGGIQVQSHSHHSKEITLIMLCMHMNPVCSKILCLV